MNDPPRPMPRSNELLSRDDSKLLIVDVQEKLIPHISVADRMIKNCRLLLQGAQILNIPVYGTEQYPKGLGQTAPALSELLAELPEKLRFSCSDVLSWGSAAEQEDDRYKIVIAGIEAHVCIQQTVLDLLSQGFQVYVPADAIASRGKLDWKFAIHRMASSGATITTTESVLFEWLEAAGTPEFKQISKLLTS